MRIVLRGGLVLSSLLSTLLVSASCSDPSSPRTPADVRLVSGANQVGRVLQELLEPVVVEVRDADGRPVAGVAVAWSVSSGGGLVSALSSSTGADGRAGVQWTLGAAAGENRLGVAVAGLDPLTIVATAQAGTAASLQLMSGDGQTGLEHLPLGDAIVVAVVDEHGNGVRNVAVTFQPEAGGMVAPQSATTDVAGVASAIWRLGAAGEQSVLVTAAGLAEQPVQFSATALAPSAIAQLASGEEVAGVTAAQGENRYFRIVVPSNATRLTVSTTGGTGDADLYVRHERLPHTGSSACKSTSPFATESCTIERPVAGNWYVLLDAFTAYSNLTLRAAYTTGGSIVLNVTGLPGSVDAGVMVTGPGGYAQRVRSSGVLSALPPGQFTVAAAYVQSGSAVYAAAVETQVVDVQADVAASVTVAYAATAGLLNLDIVNAYITQSVQRSDGSVPLVAGRDGLLRVFARGNAVSNVTPIVRARLYNGGALVRTFEIHSPTTVLPVSHDEALLTTSWNVIVPGALIQPGLTLLLDIDPTNAIAESNESDNVYPRSGPPLLLDVRPVAPLRTRLVPVVQANGTQPDLDTANRDTYTTDAQAIFPLQRIDADVRAPYTFSATLTASYDSAWQRLLSEINALRVAEASDRYYYGVFKPAYSSGGTGLGYLHQRAAIGVDWPNYRALTLAHEWGHNFGRRHVDCGGPANPDPNYPYASGRLGHHGYDIRTNTIRTLDTHYDLMSYCSPTWASDYTYESVLSFLEPTGGPEGSSAGTDVAQPGMAGAGWLLPGSASVAVKGLNAAEGGSAEPSLLIWGRISPEGAVLEPAFEVVTLPQLPSGAGPYRITGTSASGAVVLDVAFDAWEVDHMSNVRHFTFAVPLRLMNGEVPAELRLSGAGGIAVRRALAIGAGVDVAAVREGGDGVRFRWDDARAPLLVIRDGRSGEILSLARGGDARVVTTAPEVQVHISNGVRSTMRRIAVPR